MTWDKIRPTLQKIYQPSPPAKARVPPNAATPCDNYPRLSAFRRRHLPRRYLLNAGDHALDIKDMVNAAVHPAVWTHQEIGGYAPDLVQLSHRRLPAAWGADVDAGQAVLIDRLVPLVGGVQRNVQKDHLLISGPLFDFFQKG